MAYLNSAAIGQAVYRDDELIELDGKLYGINNQIKESIILHLTS